MFLFLLRGHLSDFFVMLELTRMQCRTGGQIKGGGRVTDGWLGQKEQNILNVAAKTRH